MGQLNAYYLKCVQGRSYPLAWPRWLLGLHTVFVLLIVLTAAHWSTEGPLTPLFWLLAYRSSVLAKRQFSMYARATVRCEDNGRLTVLGLWGANYRSCRIMGLWQFGGLSGVRLLTNYGKPLEILIFCRYDQRLFYQRFLRHIKYHEDLSTTDFVH